jgi:hypothetical protein
MGAALLGRLVLGRGLALSLQVLQEFYAVATWKLPHSLEPEPRLGHLMLRNQSADT